MSKKTKNLPARTPQNSGSPPVAPDDPDDYTLPPPLSNVQAELEDRAGEVLKTGDISQVWKRDHDKYPYTSGLYELSYKIGDKVTDLAKWFRSADEPREIKGPDSATTGRPARQQSERSIREVATRGRKKPE